MVNTHTTTVQQPALRAQHLSFRYHKRDQPVLNDITFTACPGITVLVGPNGAGKSTLLRALAGVTKPSEGAATLNQQQHNININITSARASWRAANIALVSQRPTVAGNFTTREVVAMGRFALPRNESQIDAAIDRFDLTTQAPKLFSELSIGQQQRAAMARAWAQLGAGASPAQPNNLAGKVLIADEPFSALDPAHTLAAEHALKELAGQGVIVITAVHDLTQACTLADAALILHAGGTMHSFGPSAQTLTPQALSDVFGVPFQRININSSHTITLAR